MLPNNFNFYITDKDHIDNFKDREITHWFTFNHPGSSYGLDFKMFKDANVYSYIFHDVYDKNAHPECLTWPREEDVINIIKQAERIKYKVEQGEQVNVLFNCAAGVSRSTATAYIILCVILGEWNEREAWAYVLNKRDVARPNPLMVTLADNLLRRGGKMIAPLKNVVDFARRNGDSNDSCLLF